MNHEDASRTYVADTLDFGEVCGVGPHCIFITPLCHRHALYALVILLVTAGHCYMYATHCCSLWWRTPAHCYMYSLLTAAHYYLLLTYLLLLLTTSFVKY